MGILTSYQYLHQLYSHGKQTCSPKAIALRLVGGQLQICGVGQDAQSPATASAAFSSVLEESPLPLECPFPLPFHRPIVPSHPTFSDTAPTPFTLTPKS